MHSNDYTTAQSLMVSVTVSSLGATQLHFLEPGVKVNGDYYRNTVLLNMLLLDIRSVFGEYYVFQQDGAPAHRARDTVTMLQRETPEFIPPEMWPPNSPDLNPVAYSIWGMLQERVYRLWIHDVNWKNVDLLREWKLHRHTVIAAAIVRSGIFVWMHVFAWMVDIWNINFEPLTFCCVLFVSSITVPPKCDWYKHVQSVNIVWNVLFLCLRLSHGMVATWRMCGKKFLRQWLWHSLAKLCTKNYENPSIFVIVTAKKSVAPFLSGHGVYTVFRKKTSTFVFLHNS